MFIFKHFSNISQGQQVFELWAKENGDENQLHDCSSHSVPRDTVFCFREVLLLFKESLVSKCNFRLCY